MSRRAVSLEHLAMRYAKSLDLDRLLGISLVGEGASLGNYLLALMIFVSTTLGCCCFASATQQWLYAKNKWYEGALLLLCTFIFMQPKLFGGMIGLEAFYSYLVCIFALGIIALITVFQFKRSKVLP